MEQQRFKDIYGEAELDEYYELYDIPKENTYDVVSKEFRLKQMFNPITYFHKNK